MLSTAAGQALFPALGSGVSPAWCGVTPTPHLGQRSPSVKPRRVPWCAQGCFHVQWYLLWVIGGARWGGGTGKKCFTQLRCCRVPALALAAIRRCPLRRFDSATWLPPPRAGTRVPGWRPWGLSCLPGGHGTWGTEEEYPCSIAHPNARVPAPPEWGWGSVGCARLPCAAARQLPQSYKEMPEPAAAAGPCRLSITHQGGACRGGVGPTKCLARARGDSAPGERHGRSKGGGWGILTPAPSRGLPLNPGRVLGGAMGAAMGVTPFWVMHRPAKCRGVP